MLLLVLAMSMSLEALLDAEEKREEVFGIRKEGEISRISMQTTTCPIRFVRMRATSMFAYGSDEDVKGRRNPMHNAFTRYIIVGKEVVNP